MSTAAYPYQDVLDWCNEIRADKGDKPLAEMPRGFQREPCQCPVARALDGDGRAMVSPQRAWRYPGDPDPVVLPFHVRWFVRHFDAGRIPDLIAGGA